MKSTRDCHRCSLSRHPSQCISLQQGWWSGNGVDAAGWGGRSQRAAGAAPWVQWFLRCTHRSAIGKMKPCATEALWREARFTVKKWGPAPRLLRSFMYIPIRLIFVLVRTQLTHHKEQSGTLNLITADGMQLSVSAAPSYF